MNKRQQFKEAVISAIHGMPYEEAIKLDLKAKLISEYQSDKLNQIIEKSIDADSCEDCEGLPITIGRVMAALNNHELSLDYPKIMWKLTKENGQECCDDDQTDEIIEALLKLIS